jgi:Cu(I)/Ag(I) efflux system membrane fusion protein
MKTLLASLLFSLALTSGLLGAESAGHDHATVYQCPMHPWIKSAQPGDKCTICGMELVAAPTGDASAAADPGLVTLTPASASVVGVQTAAITRAPLVRTLRVAGVVEDDDTRHRFITARIPGRVEKLFVNFVGAEVRAGEPLATIYSPEMLTAQRQYVERLKAGGAFPASERSAARERLLDLGLAAEEIDILEHTLEPTAMVSLRAPMSGTVVVRDVYEGQELNRDQAEQATRLFAIADFSSMWFVFDAYEPDLAWLRVGQSVDVEVPSLPGRVITAPVAFIDPTLNELTRTAKVRVVLPNPDRALLHKQTGYARVRLSVPDVLLAPRTAVLQHGGGPVVFLQQADRAFLARRVQLGRVGDEFIEILGGLQAGDRVVIEGGLLLDGQAQLARAAISEVEPPVPPVAVVAPPAPAAPADPDYPRLKILALASADAAVLLATDNLAGYQQQFPALLAALQSYLDGSDTARSGPLEKFRRTLRAPTELRTARREFEPFSRELAFGARAERLPVREGLHVFQCPMAPVLGTGRWLARTPTVQNPFFGSAMPDCGTEVP